MPDWYEHAVPTAKFVFKNFTFLVKCEKHVIVIKTVLILIPKHVIVIKTVLILIFYPTKKHKQIY